MHCAEAGWPSAKHTVKHHGQASAADLIAVAGHSLSCTKHLLRIDVSVEHVPRETVAPAGATSEKLFCTLVPVFSK
jgi:hypothetical protein